MRARFFPGAAILLALAFAPPAAGADDAVTVSNFHYVAAPQPGKGASPVESHVVVAFDVTNAGAADVEGLVATIYAGAGAGASYTVSIPVPPVRAGATVHVEVDTKALPLPYYCIALGAPPETPPQDGFSTGACQWLGGVILP